MVSQTVVRIPVLMLIYSLNEKVEHKKGLKCLKKIKHKRHIG